MTLRPYPFLLVLIAVLLPAPSSAEVDRIELTLREDVAGGQPFGPVGPYEKLAGKAYFSLDPEHPANRRIVDLGRAPREGGRVRFSADLYILKPVDAKRGNGAVFLEVPNRGGKAIVRYFHRGASRTFDPITDEAVGDGFLLRQGFTLVWVGWQWDVPLGNPDLLRLYPAFVDSDPPVEGLVRADHVFPEDTRVFPLGHRNHQAYPVADPKDRRNVLTVRDTRQGPRRVVKRRHWRFARLENGRVVDDPRSIYSKRGFEAGKIYEAVYVARGPAVVGLGFAAVRDVVSYLKHHPDSPVAAERVLGMGISQTGRFLRHFLYQGLNEDTAGRRAFDGLIVHTAGAGRGSFNHRFGQPSRDAHPFSAFFYPTDVFPFSGAVQKDPETGLEDGLFKVLQESDGQAMPKVFFSNSGYEYWGRAASLIHTTVDGRADVELSDDVRIYNFSSTQHFVGGFPPAAGATRYRSNSANFFWGLRAMIVALDAWVSRDVKPAPSRYPRRADGTLVRPRDLGFPAIPGVEVPRQAHDAYRADYGPRFRSAGIVDVQPPALGRTFGVMVAAVDADGNETGGLRLPEIAVPVATYTPWNWRAAQIGAPGELADFRGSFLPLTRTRAEREAAGDPRPSLEERYAGREDYLKRYTEAAAALVRERYLLREDLAEMIQHAEKLWEEVTKIE